MTEATIDADRNSGAGRSGGALNKTLRVSGWTLIVIGAIILEFAAYEVFGTALVTKGHQSQLRREFQAQVDDPVVEPSEPPAPDAPPPVRPKNPRAIALLKIPSIGVDVIVVDGVRLSDLAYGPGRYPSSVRIGRAGSTAIAGHRTGWGSPFLNMDKLNPGARVALETSDGKVHVYRVTRSIVVGPDDGWVLRGNPNSKAERQLTLTTCTPKYTSRNRLIVWADFVGMEGGA